jgi:hypothetical protein
MTARVLYRVTMEDASALTVLAESETDASEKAVAQYFHAVGRYATVESVDLAEGYDVA